jgi:archaetidylinositol phosphate synthase
MTDISVLHDRGVSSAPVTTRVQTSFLAAYEKQALNWLCGRMPERVKPDHLTLLGVFGAVLVFFGYVASHLSPAFLAVSIVGYCFNWYGDSLDGSLARYRGTERKRYGYFLDHSVDAVSIFLILIGLGLSGYARLDVAMFLLVGYFLMCIHVFLSKPVTGRFQLSYLGTGPTELRIGLIILTLLMILRQNPQTYWGFSLIDGILIVNVALLLSLFLYQTSLVLRELNSSDAATETKRVSNGPDDTQFWRSLSPGQRPSKNS